MSVAVSAAPTAPAVQPWRPRSKPRSSSSIPEEDSQKRPHKSVGDSPHQSPGGDFGLGGATPLLREVITKHPLQNRWSMWYFKNDKQKDWKSNLMLLASCDTVEDFWGLYNFLKAPSLLQAGCDYAFFKEGIEPMWEDPNNVKGGRWLINLNRQQRTHDLDRFWMETLLCLIGEAFDTNSDEICGTVVNIRPKGDKLAVWTADAEKRNQVVSIGVGMRRRLQVPKVIPIEFQAHKDTSTKSGSMTKKKYSA